LKLTLREGLLESLISLIILRRKKLEHNSLPRKVVKLRGLKDAYRIRVGKYQVLYRIFWKEKMIIVL